MGLEGGGDDDKRGRRRKEEDRLSHQSSGLPLPLPLLLLLPLSLTQHTHMHLSASDSRPRAARRAGQELQGGEGGEVKGKGGKEKERMTRGEELSGDGKQQGDSAEQDEVLSGGEGTGGRSKGGKKTDVGAGGELPQGGAANSKRGGRGEEEVVCTVKSIQSLDGEVNEALEGCRAVVEVDEYLARSEEGRKEKEQEEGKRGWRTDGTGGRRGEGSTSSAGSSPLPRITGYPVTTHGCEQVSKTAQRR
eukprot:764377-Hanusia_phi.AAC.2